MINLFFTNQKIHNNFITISLLGKVRTDGAGYKVLFEANYEQLEEANGS